MKEDMANSLLSWEPVFIAAAVRATLVLPKPMKAEGFLIFIWPLTVADIVNVSQRINWKCELRIFKKYVSCQLLVMLLMRAKDFCGWADKGIQRLF